MKIFTILLEAKNDFSECYTLPVSYIKLFGKQIPVFPLKYIKIFDLPRVVLCVFTQERLFYLSRKNTEVYQLICLEKRL